MLLRCALSDLTAASSSSFERSSPNHQASATGADAAHCINSLQDASSAVPQSIEVGQLAQDEEAGSPSPAAGRRRRNLQRRSIQNKNTNSDSAYPGIASKDGGNEYFIIENTGFSRLESGDFSAAEQSEETTTALHRRNGLGECPYLCTKSAICTRTSYRIVTMTKRHTKWSTSRRHSTVTGIVTRVVAADGPTSCLSNSTSSGINECTFKGRNALMKRQDLPPITASLKTKVVMHTGGVLEWTRSSSTGRSSSDAFSPCYSPSLLTSSWNYSYCERSKGYPRNYYRNDRCRPDGYVGL